MSPVQKKRMIVVVSLVTGISIASGLILYALKQNINLFYSPSALLQEKNLGNKTIRVGGMVVKNSVVRHQDLAVEFTITDYQNQTKVRYQGILPDLFKEGQGIVAQGKLDENGNFNA